MAPTNTGNTFTVTGDSGMFYGGATGLVDYEWLCLHDESCSYLPTEFGEADTISIPSLNEFRGLLRTNLVSHVVLEDGSAAYGYPVCPKSICPAVILASSGIYTQMASCPMGTMMVFTVWTAEGYSPTFELGSNALFLSASSNCPEVGSTVTCSGRMATINVTSTENPCKTLPCDFSTTGYAYGACGTSEECSYGNEVKDGEIGRPMRQTTDQMLEEIMNNQVDFLAGLSDIESMQTSLEHIESILQGRRVLLPETLEFRPKLLHAPLHCAAMMSSSERAFPADGFVFVALLQVLWMLKF